MTNYTINPVALWSCKTVVPGGTLQRIGVATVQPTKADTLMLYIQVNPWPLKKLQILTHPRIRRILPSLRRISSDSEYCLEAYWNSHIVTRAQDPKDALQLLKSFPYFQNYVELARMELCSLYAIEPVLPSRVAFLGSGPLPLTSMCLLRSLRDGLIPQQAAPMFDDGQEGQGPLVVNIDHDANALVSSTILCEKLGSWSQGMAFQCSDASSALDLGSFDVTIIAALVGVTQQEKEDIIISVAQRMRPGALMVVRSAHGLRTVLYPVSALKAWGDCDDAD